MSLKSFACTVAACCLMAAPAIADPSVTVALKEASPGVPELTSEGHFQWEVWATPDAALFNTISGGVNDGLTGGSLAVEVGLQLSGTLLDTTNSAAAGGTTVNPGTSIFPLWEPLGAGISFPEGFNTDATNQEASAYLGTGFVTTADPILIATVVTEAPDSDYLSIGLDPGSDLTTSVTWLGAYSGSGRVSQDAANFDTVAGSDSFEAISGDANFDGTTDSLDFSTLSNAFNGAGIWTDGDFNNDGTVDSLDFSILSGNFNQSTNPAPSLGLGGGGGVPEPGSVALIAGLALAGAVAVRRRK